MANFKVEIPYVIKQKIQRLDSAVPTVGTPSGKFLKDDGTWAILEGGGGGDMYKSTYDPDADGKIAEAQLSLSYATHSNSLDHNGGTQDTAIAGKTTLTAVKADTDIADALVKKHTDDVASQIATHNATTGVHGVGVGTIAKTADITATAVGLGNVNNTSDVNKPVSTVQQTALDGKANSLGVDDNYVTDAEKIVIGNTSGANTGDSSGHSGLQATLISATNIKTVNSTTLLGSGDLPVQAVLVSATNIKTINDASVLGSGNLVVSGAVPDILVLSQTPAEVTSVATGKQAIVFGGYTIATSLTLVGTAIFRII